MAIILHIPEFQIINKKWSHFQYILTNIVFLRAFYAECTEKYPLLRVCHLGPLFPTGFRLNLTERQIYMLCSAYNV